MRALLLDGSREGDRAAAGARAALLEELARRGWRRTPWPCATWR